MTSNKSKSFVEEFRERLTREDLERRWLLEALDHLISENGDKPDKFRQLMLQPLLNAGVPLEAALALVVESRFRPN